jgi:hypothetical protein
MDCGTQLRALVSAVLRHPCVASQSKRRGDAMNNIIYIVGAVVIVLFILSFIGFA